MSKSSTPKTKIERFMSLIANGRSVTPAAAARKLSTDVNNIYTMVYYIRNTHGVKVKTTDTGAYTL